MYLHFHACVCITLVAFIVPFLSCWLVTVVLCDCHGNRRLFGGIFRTQSKTHLNNINNIIIISNKYIYLFNVYVFPWRRPLTCRGCVRVSPLLSGVSVRDRSSSGQWAGKGAGLRGCGGGTICIIVLSMSGPDTHRVLKHCNSELCKLVLFNKENYLAINK